MSTTKITLLPKDNVQLKTKIFYGKFLPELCGMNREEYEQMTNTTLKRSIYDVFYSKLYPTVLLDHMVDVIVTFVQHLPEIQPQQPILESINGSTFYQVQEQSFNLAFINGVVSRISHGPITSACVVISDDCPDTVRVVTGKDELIVAFKLDCSVYEQIAPISFNPDLVMPRCTTPILNEIPWPA